MKKLLIIMFLLSFCMTTGTFADEGDILEEHPLGGNPVEIRDQYGNIFEPAPANLPQTFAELPEKYSLVEKGLVGPVRDQGVLGDCWAYAATNSLTSNMIKNGAWSNTSEYCLSPTYLTWYALSDTVKNGEGERVFNPHDNGGNYINAFMTMAQGLIEVNCNEETDSYNAGKVSYINSGGEDISTYKLKSVEKYDDNQINVIKQSLMDNGAMSVSVFMNSDNYNEENCSFYQNAETTSNHSVTLVGWDDNYPTGNFNSDLQPENNGAWLVQNSWGTDWGNNGYFYISYEDTSLEEFCSFFVDESGWDNLYTYTYANTGNCLNFGENVGKEEKISAEFASKYTAKGKEELTKVGLITYNNNVDVEIKVYKNVKEDNSAVVSDELYTTKNISIPLQGFNSVELDKPVPLSKGERFSVVCTYSVVGEKCSVPIELENSYATFNSNTGESFIFNGEKWLDSSELYENWNNIEMYAYTNNDDDSDEITEYKGKLKNLMATCSDESIYEGKSYYTASRLLSVLEDSKAVYNDNTLTLQDYKNAYGRLNQCYLGLDTNYSIGTEGDLAKLYSDITNFATLKTGMELSNDITITKATNTTDKIYIDIDGNNHTIIYNFDEGEENKPLINEAKYNSVYDVNIDGVLNTNGIARVGGLMGYFSSGSVTNCSFYGEINSLNCLFVGGIVGINISQTEKCVNYGNIYGDGYIGGISGYSENDAEHSLTNCGNYGNVSSSNEAYAIAYTNNSLNNCFNAGTGVINYGTGCYDVNNGTDISDFESGKVAYKLNTVDGGNNGIWAMDNGFIVVADDTNKGVSAVNMELRRDKGNVSITKYINSNQVVELLEGATWYDSSSNKVTQINERASLEDVSVWCSVVDNDINLDGNVDDKDRAYILKELTNPYVFSEEQYALSDVDENGKVDILDAVKVAS